MTAFLPPLPVMARVRWPRAVPRASTSAPVASDTRSPLRASSEIGACSAAVPSPAATSSAPTSLRSQGGGVRFVVDPRPADVRGRGVVEQVLLDGVRVQPGDGGQPAGDGRAGSCGGFEVAGEQLDVSAADSEQAQLPLAAPGGELAQVQGVSLAGHA